jgi:hypothetical protein
MKSKGGRPKKEATNLRLKNVMVSFSIDEYETLQGIMERTGHDSPAVFLRVSGLRSRVPARVFVPELNRRLHEKIIEGVNAIKEMRDSGEINEYNSGQFLVNLRSIAGDVIDTGAYKRIELMQLEIDRLNAIIQGGAK